MMEFKKKKKFSPLVFDDVVFFFFVIPFGLTVKLVCVYAYVPRANEKNRYVPGSDDNIRHEPTYPADCPSDRRDNTVRRNRLRSRILHRQPTAGTRAPRARQQPAAIQASGNRTISFRDAYARIRRQLTTITYTFIHILTRV